MNKILTPAAVVGAALTLTFGAGAVGHASVGSSDAAAAPTSTVSLPMQVSSPALAHCFPHASATVNVDLTTDERGFDTVRVKARGLQPDTAFTVFLIEKAGAPFGAAEYIGDFFTDGNGRASNRFKLITGEAFAFNNETHTRTDLNSVGFWFADPADDDACLGAGSPVTGFDGDASAGVQMMNSGAGLLP